jgi:Tfp pilus assembly protein FimV
VVAPRVQGLGPRANVVRPAVARLPVTERAGRRAGLENRVHVVVAGESLWSIANDMLGGRATVAQVAREVNRLWELNRARIGTGDRDLLPVGTRLELK